LRAAAHALCGAEARAASGLEFQTFASFRRSRWCGGAPASEDLVVELLPAQRDTPIFYKTAALSERELRNHDATVIGCAAERGEQLLSSLPHAAAWRRAFDQVRARGQTPSVLTLRLPDSAAPVAVVFFKKDPSAFERLTIAARAWKELQGPVRARVLLATVGLEPAASGAALEALATAVLAATAPMPAMKTKAVASATPSQLTILHAGKRPDLARTTAVDRGNHLARWLTALPPNVLDSAAYRRALRRLAEQRGWQFTFLNEAALRRAGAGAFLAVARANEHRDAGVVRLRRKARRGGGDTRRLALVGKGICFDTGGINLKTHKSMYLMHEDMQGSAVAVGSMLALDDLDVPFDIECWLAITENQIGPRAYRPQEVVRAANGVTIQVVHSDAEGRMALADALALASRGAPDLIIDFATLTGACVIALGDRYAGAFVNRPELREAVEAAGRASGERVWPFPMDEDYDAELDSTIADILQCTPDSKADHILAARFLSRFVPADIPWLHLDLATSNRSGGLAHIPTDFTGFGVRFVTELLLEHDVLKRRERGARQTGKLASRRTGQRRKSL
jgi:leucyl aminopeptidase